jgi:hypothetical protein
MQSRIGTIRNQRPASDADSCSATVKNSGRCRSATVKACDASSVFYNGQRLSGSGSTVKLVMRAAAFVTKCTWRQPSFPNR